MNGFVAILKSRPPRRIVRATLVLLCCGLSASLIGAVHTRPLGTPDRVKVEANPPAQEAELATFQVPTRQRLKLSIDARPAARAPGSGELLQDVKTVAGAISTQIQKTLLSPAARAVAVPAPSQSPAGLGFTVRWMEVTAYCACRKCCGPRAQGITASGRPVTFNGGKFVAADRAVPFNTRLVIPGYNESRPVPVLDRGGAIKGDKLDVYFPSHEQARQWGRRMIPVQVLN